MLDVEIVKSCNGAAFGIAQDTPKALDALAFCRGGRKDNSYIGRRDIKAFIEGPAGDQGTGLSSAVTIQCGFCCLQFHLGVVAAGLAGVFLIQFCIQQVLCFYHTVSQCIHGRGNIFECAFADADGCTAVYGAWQTYWYTEDNSGGLVVSYCIEFHWLSCILSRMIERCYKILCFVIY